MNEHNTKSENCWCNPIIETMDNGNKVVIHNDIKQKDNNALSDILLAHASANSVAALIKAIRKIRKLTILEVAKKSGIHRNTISAIESGNAINQASVTTLSQITHAIGCDLRIELIPFEKFTDKAVTK